MLNRNFGKPPRCKTDISRSRGVAAVLNRSWRWTCPMRRRTSTNRLEKHITFLATTAAVTPFIGLFGTVLGIISAFQGIGAQGSTSLDVVAPGIADALIATAAGLAAAIPAVYFYNLLTQRVKNLASEMDDFSLEFLNIVERNFT